MPKVYFVPKKVAQDIRTPVNLISINDPYGSWAEFSVKHNLLKLGFINHYSGIQEHSFQHLIQDEDIQRVMDFATPLLEKGEEIVVHCGEGSVRSPAIAHFIHHMAEYVAMAPAYNPSGTYRDHRGSDHHMCRHTYHTCVNYYNKKLTEGKTLIEMDEATKLCDDAGVEWRRAYALLEWYKIDGKRMFAKEEVEAALAKIQAAAQPQSEEVEAINTTMPRVINTGVKDCSAGGCERCKKDKQ